MVKCLKSCDSQSPRAMHFLDQVSWGALLFSNYHYKNELFQHFLDLVIDTDTPSLRHGSREHMELVWDKRKRCDFLHKRVGKGIADSPLATGQPEAVAVGQAVPASL